MKERKKNEKIFITGGAGFIGCNTALRYSRKGFEVIVLDNLSRQGSAINLEWLKSKGKITFVNCDIRNFSELNQIFKENPDIGIVIHLAAQVAVTTSVHDPREDFEVNALGTFNLLESIRVNKLDPIILNASTNKVYGRMDEVKVSEGDKTYFYRDYSQGISEDRPLDFYSPYGCSKGTADQYAHDYSRIYGLRTVNFRQSCIYGYRQFGVEDQGWVAWFIIAFVLGKKVTIYGDGKQVRDILFIDDLIDCYEKAIENIDRTAGKNYNCGGGANNQLSLLQLIDMIEELSGKKFSYSFDNWRPGDQKVFVCNIEKARHDFGWQPKVSKEEGIKLLYKWVIGNKGIFEQFN